MVATNLGTAPIAGGIPLHLATAIKPQSMTELMKKNTHHLVGINNVRIHQHSLLGQFVSPMASKGHGGSIFSETESAPL